MATIDMLMPKMGESIAEATIVKWTKNVGDKVKKDEIVLEISTDKVDSEVPAPAGGVLTEILYKTDDVVEVGKVIARISDSATAGVSAPAASPAPAANPTKAAPAPAAASSAASAAPASVSHGGNGHSPARAGNTPVPRTDGKRFYSPVVRAMAQEAGVALEEIENLPGSGKDGRISRKDLEAYLGNRTAAPVARVMEVGAPAQPTHAPASTGPAPVARSAFGEKKSLEQLGLAGKPVEVVKMSTVRKAIVKAMRNTIDTAAHVNQVHEVDLTRIVKFRESIKNRFKSEYGFNLTYTSFFIWASCRALERFPMVNSMINGDEVIIKKFVNYGFAVALDSGDLIVPNIKNCQNLNLVGIATAVEDLGKRAKSGKLNPDDTSGGTFTLTNVGSFGPIMGMPLINQPESAIMGAGKIVKRPVMVTEDSWGFRDMVYLSLAFDHRLVDGALAGRFMMAIEDELQNFDTASTGLERRLG
ncbi:MAG: 2-oxo acid dehydrogenase subunit E2 [Planctomycetes bacterium]|nr:2-oxo acid dehydrogenase subunit E2 [Planctomycetota bacterium]